MFDSTSRYAGMPTGEHLLPAPDDGSEPAFVRYVRRRFVPHPDAGATLVEHRVTQEERLDHVTARHLGDPAQFWRVADANRELRPDALVEEPGRRVRVALPSGVQP